VSPEPGTFRWYAWGVLGGLLALWARLGCLAGSHAMSDPNGFCTDCGRKVCRGRCDPWSPEGTMWVGVDL
jgi:hypothetical protein